ncbi:MAG: ribbon-helix-helix domain-containing protein [Thermoplasmata archaeon]
MNKVLDVYRTKVVSTTKRKHYRGLTLPESLVEKVEQIIKSRKDLGYVSVSEFVKEAVRRRIEEIESRQVSEKKSE